MPWQEKSVKRRNPRVKRQSSDGDIANEIAKNDTRLYVWPNPFSGNVTLSFDLAESVDNVFVSIYNK